jgi:glutathione S-transferase
MQLVIGNQNYSSWSLRPWLLLAAHDITFEKVRIPLDTPATAAQLAKWTPAGRVPVLHDGGLSIWDSLAICEYVSEKYLDGAGWPSNPSARAMARSCCAEMHSGFFALRNQLPMNCRALGRKVEITAELQGDIARIDALWSSLRARYGADGLWLFGAFSIADCMFAPVVFRFHTYGIKLSDPAAAYRDSLLKHPQMQIWLKQAQAENEVITRDEVGESP